MVTCIGTGESSLRSRLLLGASTLELVCVEPGPENRQGGRVVGPFPSLKGSVAVPYWIGGHHDRQLQLDFLVWSLRSDDKLRKNRITLK